MKQLVFCILTVCCGGALSQLNVRVDIFADEMTASHFGSQEYLLNDREAALWSLHPEDRCKDYVLERRGERRPTDCFLREPTPWRLYPTYADRGWREVGSLHRLISSQVIATERQPVHVHQQVFKNNHPNISVEYSLELRRVVTDTITVTSSANTEFSAAMSFNVAGSGVEFGMTHTIGKEEQTTSTKTLEIGSGARATLPPSSSLIVKYYLFEGKGQINVVSRNTLTGCIAANYNPRFQGHHFWCVTPPSAAKTMTESFRINYMTTGYIVSDLYLPDGTTKTLNYDDINSNAYAD